MISSSPGSDQTVHNLVSEFLELLPEPTQRLVHLGSIPNAINAELLRKMAVEEVDAASILETLQEFYFLNQGEGGWYSFSPAVRHFLLAYWNQAEQVERFQQANRIAIAFFDDLANQTNPPGKYVFQRQALYHRLLADENAGLEFMADLFERACDQRQIGAAQNFAIQLTQTLAQLSPSAGEHASYYEMRLDFLLNRRKNLQENLEGLMRKTTDPHLKARAGILLGQALLAQYEWKQSADTLKSSIDQLRSLAAWRYAARAMLALADVYFDLVENSGGVQPEVAKGFSRLSQFLSDVIFLPFLLLDWLKRKIWFMPGWFYFSGNYQDWILNYLLQMAGSWYHRAWRLAQNVGDDATSVKALFGQSNVAVQQRREAKAKRNYSRLARLPDVQSSDYRRAQVLYGQGQVSLLGNRRTHASQELKSALTIFRSFADEGNVATVAQTLGRTYLRLFDYESAANAFLESLRASRELQDPLSQTQIAWELEQLVEKKQVSDPLQGQIREALARNKERHFLARFPSDLLQRFRTMAYWVALPLSYVLLMFVGLLVCLSLIAIEYSALLASTTGSLSQSDIFFLLVVGILPIFLAFWIFGLIYAFVGQIWVFIAGRNSLNMLGEQPDRVILTPEALMIDRTDSGESLEVQWKEIRELISADYRLWQRPIHLLSRQGMVTDRQKVIIDGITSGYMQIRKEIMQKIGGTAKQINADLVMLAHRSTYIVILLAALHAQVLVSSGQIDVSVDDIQLFLSPWLICFVADLIMILPPLILWRIYLQRNFLEQKLGMRAPGFRKSLRLSVAVILSILAFLWLLVSPFLAVGGD
jgi:hypothetical protein